MAGMHAKIVSRHRANGSVSSNAKNNIFISVGQTRNVHRPTLADEYPGGLCEAALCSFKKGKLRFLVCDCKGEKSHSFASLTGPADTKRSARVTKKSKATLSIALKKGLA